MKFLGYEVETEQDEKGRKKYILYGSRTAVYELVRYENNPEIMYAINLRDMRKIVTLKGNSTFTDRAGFLNCVYG